MVRELLNRVGGETEKGLMNGIGAGPALDNAALTLARVGVPLAEPRVPGWSMYDEDDDDEGEDEAFADDEAEEDDESFIDDEDFIEDDEESVEDGEDFDDDDDDEL
jgi:hypothetical protein